MLQKIIIILLLSLNCFCFSQAISEQSFYAIEKPEESGEEIVIETDRQFYCSDERIYFTARYAFSHPMDDIHWSNVLYVELIRWNGEKIAQAKVRLNENSASGYLTIPGTLLSGNYYLRAYTKWMRNYPVAEYSYKLIKVINPFESKIDTGPVQQTDKGVVQLKPTESNVYHRIECFTDKNVYKQREKVNLTVRLNHPGKDDSNVCVSVAKAAHLDTSNYFIQVSGNMASDEQPLIYLPECRGVSISGKIVNTDSSISLANSTIHLSTPQNWKYFTSFITKENGLFNFTLPDIYGQYDFYIDAAPGDEEPAEILIDNDYCNRSIELPYIPFSLDSAEMKSATEMAVNMQLSKLYNEQITTQEPGPTELPFYGWPKQVYYTEEYVQLPNLEEFFFELVREVRVVRVKTEAYLKVVRYSQYHDLDPLILLDNIPVSDVDEFLKIPLDKIEKIEIVNEPYIVAGIKYSGVICTSTKNKDFAGIKLNKNSLFFSFNVLSEGTFTMPDYGSIQTHRDTYRHNLLFWDPDIELNQNNDQTLSFYTSDSKGEYIVYIRSINSMGKPQVYGTCKIVVE
jgi:hypothetical protein